MAKSKNHTNHVRISIAQQWRNHLKGRRKMEDHWVWEVVESLAGLAGGEGPL